MASQITIGRFGSDFDTTEIDTWTVSGERVRCGGELFCASVADALAARQQINGLTEFDGPVLVTWADDASQNGFYRVLDASVDTAETTLATGVIPWSASLERVRGFSGLRPELTVSASTRGAAMIVAGYFDPWIGVPTDYGIDSRGISTTTTTRNLASGSVTMIEAASYPLTILLAGTSTYTYNGAAKIKAGGYTVIGRRCSQDAWELSNGITTVTPPSNTAGLFRVKTVAAAGTAATVTYEVYLGSIIAAAFVDVTSMTQDTWVVLRESIEQVAIRIHGRVTAGGTIYPYTLDLILNRGDRGVVAMFRSGARQWGIRWSSVIASTLLASLDNAIQANSADADSNKPVLIINPYDDSGGSSDDAANAKLWIDTTKNGINIFAGSSCSGTGNTAAALAGNFAAPINAQQRMVHP